MKKNCLILTFTLVFISMNAFCQSTLKEYKVGHIFNVSLPEYMIKTTGFNEAASIQYKNVVRDVAGFIILDTKESLELVEINFGSINEFYDNFIADFLKDEFMRKISKPKTKKIGEINFVESDASYYDNDSQVEIYYLVGIVETPNAYYKVISWCTSKNKAKFKSEFQKILYSVKD